MIGYCGLAIVKGLRMKISMVLAAAVCAVSLHNRASAATIDFNTAVEPGSDTLVIGSVSITRLGGLHIGIVTSPNGTPALLGNGTTSGGSLLASQWTATFASLQNSVSIDLGDFGGDQDIVYLTAFNASNIQIGTVSQTLAIGFNGMVRLNLTVPDIKSIRFGQSNDPGGIFADNLTFSPVPIPAVLPVFAAAVGFLGFIGWRTRRRALLAA